MQMLESQSTTGSTKHRPTLVNIMDSGTLTTNVITTTSCQTQVPVMPVSFASTTQVRMDVSVPPIVNTTVTIATTARVPLSQITSMATTRNIGPLCTSSTTKCRTLQEVWKEESN